MNRRAFLLGATALTLAPLVAKVELINNIPEIRGDGVHDDAPGINALLRNDPCRIIDKCVRLLNDNTLHFEAGNYYVKSAIKFNSTTRATTMINCTIKTDHKIPAVFYNS